MRVLFSTSAVSCSIELGMKLFLNIETWSKVREMGLLALWQSIQLILSILFRYSPLLRV